MWDILFEYKDGTYLWHNYKNYFKTICMPILLILILIPTRNLWIIDVSAVQH